MMSAVTCSAACIKWLYISSVVDVLLWPSLLDMVLMQHYDRAQAGEYLKRHLAYAGAEHDIFSDASIDEIYRVSSGAARLINKVCTHSLIYGAQNGRRIIDDRMVRLVVQSELS